MKESVLKISEVVGNALKDRALTIAAAESCTGGALLNALTDIPGSSAYTSGGIVAYSNRVKIEQLNVNEADINRYGAVSKTVALQMAKNVAGLLNTDLGISTTGIAGPSGGSDEKPVGTVWMGFWSKQRHFALKANFSNNRLENKNKSVKILLEVVRCVVLNIQEMPEGLKPQTADE